MIRLVSTVLRPANARAGQASHRLQPHSAPRRLKIQNLSSSRDSSPGLTWGRSAIAGARADPFGKRAGGGVDRQSDVKYGAQSRAQASSQTGFQTDGKSMAKPPARNAALANGTGKGVLPMARICQGCQCKAIFRFALEQSRRIDDTAGYMKMSEVLGLVSKATENRSAIRRALPCARQR